MKRFLENDIKILSLPLSILVGIIILSFVSGKIIIDNIGRLNQEVSDNNKTQSSLEFKLNSLQKVNQQISDSSEIVISALPGTSSVLATINELQFQANSQNLILENIKSFSNTTNQSSSSALIATEIDFDADGTYQNLSIFIKTLKNLVPITRFDSIRINNQNVAGSDLYRLSATLFTYWAPLPATISSIGEPLVELTADEEQVLSQISKLQRPTLSSPGNVSGDVIIGRSDPFNN